jgi:hypothetical protein
MDFVGKPILRWSEVVRARSKVSGLALLCRATVAVALICFKKNVGKMTIKVITVNINPKFLKKLTLMIYTKQLK